MDDALPLHLEKAVWMSRCAIRLQELQPSLGSLEARDTAEKLAEAAFSNLPQPGCTVLGPEQQAEAYLSSQQPTHVRDDAGKRVP